MRPYIKMDKMKKADKNHITVIDYEEAWKFLKRYFRDTQIMNKAMGIWKEGGPDFEKMMIELEKKHTRIEKVQ